MKKLQLVNVFILGVLLLINIMWLFNEGFGTIIDTIRTNGIDDDGYLYGFPSLIAGIILIFYLISTIKFYKKDIKNINGFIITSNVINIITTALVGWCEVLYLHEVNMGTGILLGFSLVLGIVLIIISYILFIVGRKKFNIV